jgi:hypothetical protein
MRERCLASNTEQSNPPCPSERRRPRGAPASTWGAQVRTHAARTMQSATPHARLNSIDARGDGRLCAQRRRTRKQSRRVPVPLEAGVRVPPAPFLFKWTDMGGPCRRAPACTPETDS